MRTLLLSLCAAAVLGCSHDSPLSPDDGALDTSPFVGQIDGRIATNTHLDTVVVGDPVMLRWTEMALASYAWTLTRPAGSVATLAGGASPTPSFTPDIAGTYFATLRGARASGGAVEETRRIVAATLIGDAACAVCHEERADRTALTAHAAPDGASCEDCHGPGSAHQGDPRRITITLRAQNCASCHDGSVSDDTFTPWQASAHGNAPPAATIDDQACRRCHTAQGYLDSIGGATPNTDGLDPQGPTCAVCHDPHAGRTPSMMRRFGVAPLATGGAVDSGRAAACVACHQSDIADPEAFLATAWRFPCAVQADMLNGRGGVEFGGSFSSSFHGGTVFRLRPSTGNPDDPDYPDACVTCHMLPAGLGGHFMRLREGTMELAAGNCDRCHSGLIVFNRPMDVDFDGDGLNEGSQTEVKRLTEVVYVAIRTADSLNGLSRPGGALTPIMVSGDLARTSPLLRRAAYNYNFVILDGSFGIHNTTYAVQLLQRTYEQVTGVAFGTAFPDADVR